MTLPSTFDVNNKMSTLLIEHGIHINFDECCTDKCLLHFISHIDNDKVIPAIPDSVQFIYTSEFNAWILKNKFKMDPKRIVALPIETTLNFADKILKLQFKITLFDANHSPGSVMYLFESSKLGTILYTGHFCYKPSLFTSKIFQGTVGRKKLTCLYLDVSYLRFKNELPTKRIVVQRIDKLIKSFPDHKICIFLKDLTSDNILNDIACKIKEPIYVNDLKMEMLKNLKLEEGFTTDPSKARVYGLALDADDVIQLMKNNLKSNTPVLKILLSTSSVYLSSNVGQMQHKGVHLFSYRTHSSSEELKLIINKLKPKQVMSCSSGDNTILQEFLQKINYKDITNSDMSQDFWKTFGNVDKVFSSAVFKGTKTLGLNSTSPSELIEISSTSGGSSVVESITPSSTFVKKDILVDNLCSSPVDVDAECSSGADSARLVIIEDSSDGDSKKESESRMDSNCNIEISDIKNGIKNSAIQKYKNRKAAKQSNDLKKTLLNLKYKVELCNIVESVNFLQSLGLKPTWKNKTLYKSTENLSKYVHRGRRKQEI